MMPPLHSHAHHTHACRCAQMGFFSVRISRNYVSKELSQTVMRIDVEVRDVEVRAADAASLSLIISVTSIWH